MLSLKKPAGHLLFIDDDVDLLEVIRDYYRPRGYRVDLAESAFQPLERFRQSQNSENPYDVVICDLKMPKFDGLEFIREMRSLSPTTPIILMTAHSSIELAVQAVREGAYDFVNKPLNFSQLTVAIERALSLRKIQSENETLRSVASATKSLDGMIARSPNMLNVISFARRIASSEANVLIQGESGTGKEVIARAIHTNSARSNGPFVAINCSAIPETLLESELFGYAKGAFTGAQDKKIGLFEEANEGTLFLDEIGDLSQPLQAKLLRVLQERQIKRVGENQYRPINVRILAATHKTLETEVQKGNFRQDLFFRLNVIRIDIPALRERRDDILPLADVFLKKFAAKNGSMVRGFSKEAQEYLFSQEWPGNVRELENAIERAVILSQNDLIQPQDLPSLSNARIQGQMSGHSSQASSTESSSASAGNPSQGWTTPGTHAPSSPTPSLPSSQQSSGMSSSHMMPQAPVLPGNSMGGQMGGQMSGQMGGQMGHMMPQMPGSNPYAMPNHYFVPSEEAALFLPLQNRETEDLPTLNEISLDYVQFVLKRVGGVRERAARVLDIDRKTLYRKIDEYKQRTAPVQDTPAAGTPAPGAEKRTTDTSEKRSGLNH